MRLDHGQIGRAFALALELHGDQRRKGTDVPYIGHLLGVASIVIDDGGGETEVLAALLHDGPEDAGGEATLARIRDRFGGETAEIVARLSDTFEDPKPPWRERKERYLADLAAMTATGLGRKVLRVSLADKLHNARSIRLDAYGAGDRVWDRFTGGREGSLWYYRTLAGIYRDRLGPTALVEEFAGTVDSLGRLSGGDAPGPGR